MIVTNDIWVLMGDMPFYIPKGQEFSTNNTYEEFSTFDSFIERLNELEIEYEIESLKPIKEKPNWDNFNTQMMTNPRFNQVYNQCLQIAPIVANSFPTALDQVTSKPSLSLFTLIWTQLCTIGGATAEDKIVWGEYAEANNLPQEFITILVQ